MNMRRLKKKKNELKKKKELKI